MGKEKKKKEKKKKERWFGGWKKEGGAGKIKFFENKKSWNSLLVKNL